MALRSLRPVSRPLLRLLILLSVCLFALLTANAQDATWDYAVQVSAVVQSSPPRITLTWPQDSVLMPSKYTVYRKLISDTSWGTGAVLSGATTNFVDSNVSDGSAYEYQIVKVTSNYKGYGYIYAGIDAPLTEFRGTVVLIVDNTFSANLSDRLTRLQQDLVGDGWAVLRHDVSPTDSVASVKSLIQADYNSDPANVNTVFLFGHIPVPYSGNIAPDEHVPTHQGAWPADVYYGNLTGTWTDTTVYNKSAADSRNWNVPGDGKFDQSYPPGPVQLMVGRVDLHNLPGEIVWEGPPTLPDEQTLLANYLDKDHNFRQRFFDLPRQGVVGDYFGDYGGEAFAASGWRNFAPFFGAANVTTLFNEGTWLSTLNWQPYLWSYGCGSGTYNSVAGLGNDDANYTAITPDFYNADIQSVFVMLFGSYFGDWDSQDDLMRGVLATPHYGLACLWSGSPHWFCHHMALGQTLGYSTRLTQNNATNGLYKTQVTTYAGQVHVALMGDPTLRMHVVGPPANLTANMNSAGVQLTWNASADTVVGYNIYRAASPDGPFARLNGPWITGDSFADTNAPGGSETYIVRAVKLETSGSGTYYNGSEGTFLTMNVALPLPMLSVSAAANASRVGPSPGAFTLTRAGDVSTPLTANYALGGSAIATVDYQLSPANSLNSISFPAGAASATLTVLPQPSSSWVGNETIQLTLLTTPSSQYLLGTQTNAAITLGGNGITGVSLHISNSTATLSWPSASGQSFHVAYENSLSNAWTDFGVEVQGMPGAVFWNDPGSNLAPQRFYHVFETK